MSTIPHLPPSHPPSAPSSYDDTTGDFMCRWSLQACDLWIGPVHCGLSRASTSGVYCSRLVSMVHQLHFRSNSVIINMPQMEIDVVHSLTTSITSQMVNAEVTNTLQHYSRASLSRKCGTIMVSLVILWSVFLYLTRIRTF